MTNTITGRIGESAVYEMLIQQGIDAEWLVGKKAEADFKLKDGRLVDVKYANQRYNGKTPVWFFSLHHHGKKQKTIDFFICIANMGEGNHKVFVFPGKILQSKTFSITKKQMERGKYDYFLGNFTLIDPSIEKNAGTLNIGPASKTIPTTDHYKALLKKKKANDSCLTLRVSSEDKKRMKENAKKRGIATVTEYIKTRIAEDSGFVFSE